MGAHNTYLHFVGRQSLKLCLLHHRQNLQAVTMFQKFVLKFFSSRFCRQYLTENRFFMEFEAKKEVQAMEGTK